MTRVPDGCPLTLAEFECVELLAEGLAVKQIAVRRHVTHSTVRGLLNTAYKRLGVVDRAHAVIKCERAGWLGRAPMTRIAETVLLQQIKPILEDCLRQLEHGTRHRVTRSQYAYLQAFDTYLRRPGNDTDGSLGTALAAVLEDAHVTPSGRRQRQRGRTRRLELRPTSIPTAEAA